MREVLDFRRVLELTLGPRHTIQAGARIPLNHTRTSPIPPKM